MNKRIMLRNKMILGALTMGDLREIVDIEGEFCFASNWLPIHASRKRKGTLQIFIEYVSSEPDVEVPLNSIVKVQGNMVFVDLDTSNIGGGSLIDRDKVELKIRLNDEPFPDWLGLVCKCHNRGA
jgi:hypothetical protein